MSVRVGINGFGRIGRLVFRALVELARALVASGTLRVAAGTWLFPAKIDDGEVAELSRLALGDELERLNEAENSENFSSRLSTTMTRLARNSKSASALMPRQSKLSPLLASCFVPWGLRVFTTVRSRGSVAAAIATCSFASACSV
ncbi:hypothetical protein B4Q13_18815 [Lacticaseibacillus rhamnosus]